MSEHECTIWPGFPATLAPSVGDGLDKIESERAGGRYTIEFGLARAVQELDDLAKARLTTWLVDQRQQGVPRPNVTLDVIAYARTKRPLSVDERAERLLRYLVEQSARLGAPVEESRLLFMAWTESTDGREVDQLADYLEECGWITKRKGPPLPTISAIVTIDGHRQAAAQAVNTDSAQAFVAMWFDKSTDSAYLQGLAPAIRDAGYAPLRIDQEEHIDRIDDRIIAGIRRSRFVVADFTQGDDGARGGVYYEAGFAHGLGLPVVFTCHRDQIDKLHFDTNHYVHIDWSTPTELRDRLRTRILAVIGEGPELRKGA